MKQEKNIIKQYSEKLMIEVGKKYNERTLRRIRQFYELFKKEKWSALRTELCWSHYKEVLILKDFNTIRYYLNQCQINNLTYRQLHEKIKNKEYERLPAIAKDKFIKQENLEIADLVPNHLTIKIDNENDNLNEYMLKEAIMTRLDEFLMELGRGFAYIGNEYKIKVDNKYNYIDILLYNIKYKCYIVIELKNT